MTITVDFPEKMNEFEMIQVQDHMAKNYPNRSYHMRPGNDCIWVTMGNVHFYFIFRNGKIVDIQAD